MQEDNGTVDDCLIFFKCHIIADNYSFLQYAIFLFTWTSWCVLGAIMIEMN